MQSVDRALEMLEYLAAHGEAGVTDLATHLAVHKSTAFRLVGALEGRGLVEQPADRTSGADAAAMVMGSLSERGTITPRRATVVFWGALTGAVAAIMLIIAALPFVLVMVLLCFSLWKDLRSDPLMVRDRVGAELVTSAVVNGQAQHRGPFDLVTSRRTDDDTEPPAAG